MIEVPVTTARLGGRLVAAGGGGSSVTNPVAGSAPGMVIWTGTQSAYDGIATKSTSTVYLITG